MLDGALLGARLRRLPTGQALSLREGTGNTRFLPASNSFFLKTICAKEGLTLMTVALCISLSLAALSPALSLPLK